MSDSQDPLITEFDRLINSLCDQSISQAEFNRLQELALSKVEFRRQYIEQMNLHAALGWNRAESDIAAGEADLQIAQVGPIVKEPRVLPTAQGGKRTTRRSVLASTAMVAAAFYGIFTLLAWNLQPFVLPSGDTPREWMGPSLVVSNDLHQEEFVARLVSAEDCQWVVPAGQIAVNDRLIPQRLQLAKGTAEIAFASGVHAVLEGPCSLELRSPSIAFLAAGSVIAHVPTAAVGFTVETPSARVVDLGTEFGVEVNESGDTALHVFAGAVDIQTSEMQLATSPEPIAQRRVTAGESLRVVARTLTFASESHAAERFVHRPHRDARKFAPPKMVIFPAAATVAESSSMNAQEYPARAAIDGDVETFTHTTGGDANPWWKLDLSESRDVAVVVLQNRIQCCGGRLRDVVVSLLAEDGKTVVARSPVLNRDNAWGGGLNDFNHGPSQIVYDITQTNGNLARARFVMVERAIPVPPAQTHDDNALSLAEVQVFESTLIVESRPHQN